MRFLPILAAASGLVAGSFAVAQAVAQGTAPAIRLSLSIEAQPLRTALRAFESQTGLQVSYREEDVDTAGVMAPKVIGELKAEEALRLLLSGTGLTFEFINPRLVRVSSATESAPESKVAEGEKPTAKAAAERPHRIRLAQADERHPDSAGSGMEAAESRDALVAVPEVLVEGSRILNMDIRRSRDDAQPYVVFDRKTIAESGVSNVEEFLRQRLTMNTTPAPSGQSTASNQSSINLRGLGTDQTLILIDGHRASATVNTAGTPSQPDLNGIPLAAVERIEILPATASGIYGGSATGGVVNVVLRRDYSGIETRISYDNSFSGNSSTRRADLGAGFSLEKGKSNILLALSYSDANSLRLSDRDFIERGRAHIRANNPDFFFAPTSPPPLGQTPNIRSVSGAPLFGPGTPSFTTVPVGYAGGGGVAPLETNAGNYNLNAANTAQVGGGGARSLTNAPTLKSGMATFRRQFGSRVQGFLEVSASDNAGEFVLSGAASSTFTIAPTAPNNPFGQAIQVTIPIPESASVQFSNNQVRRAVGGAIVRLPNNWSAGADFTWSTNRTVVRDLPPGTMSAQAVAAIQNGSIDVLRDLNAFPIDFTDMLAPPTQMSPTKSTLRAGMIRAAGPTRSILGITPIISTSIEYRREFFDESRSISPTSVTLRPSKSQTTKSAYAEARLPLVAPDRAATGVKELELQVAVRHDDYTTNGVTGSVVEGSTTPIVRAKNKTESTNPTFALRYAPIADLALRASYGTGFLPPSVSQLVPSRLTTAQTVVDPRRGGSLTTLPAGQVLTGGNPDLDPEESKSWSAGLIFTPRLLPGLRLSVDYIHVEKTDEITSPFANVQDVVDRESIFPDRVVRAEPALGDPFGVGPIIEVRRTLVNVARTEVEAIDAALDFRSASTAAGTFTFYALATWQPHFKTQLISTAPVEEWVGVAAFNPLKVKINAGITWERDGWNVGWHSRYFHSYLVADPSLAFNQSTTIPNQGGDGRVPSQMYHDVVVSYRPAPGRSFLGTSVLAKTEFRAGVRNVFNKKPPFDASDTIRYYSPFGDPRLATYHLSVSKQF